MTASGQQHYRDKLLQLQAELQGLEKSLSEAGETVQLDQSRQGRLSRMDAMQGQQMALEVARRRKLQLAKIDGALKRIDAGEFGVCFGCGEAIDSRRLEADPTHTRCIACMES